MVVPTLPSAFSRKKSLLNHNESENSYFDNVS